MLGTFQTSLCRINVPATPAVIAEHLQDVALIRQWAWPQQYPTEILRLTPGLTFTSYLGWLSIGHRVETITPNALTMVLWGAVDGLSQWTWGDQWLEQTTTGVTLLPLMPAQRQLLFQLETFLRFKHLASS